MSWKCINDIYNEKDVILFFENVSYEEQDDRGESDDIAICLCDELGIKQYLVDQFVRNNFIEELDEEPDVVELLKKNIHDVMIANGRSEKYFSIYWAIWWSKVSIECKIGLFKTFEQIKNKNDDN
jgi:hypothetical protein